MENHQAVEKVFSEKVAKTLNLPKCDLYNTTGDEVAKDVYEKAAQFDRLMGSIKEKVSSCNTSREKIQYLTLCPCEWSIEKCSDYFQVSQYLILRARDAAKENGVLSLPLQKKGRSVSNDTKEHFMKMMRYLE